MRHSLSSTYRRTLLRKGREQKSRWGLRVKKGVLLLFWFGSPIWEESLIYMAGSLPRLEHHVIYFSVRGQGIDPPLPMLLV